MVHFKNCHIVTLKIIWPFPLVLFQDWSHLYKFNICMYIVHCTYCFKGVFPRILLFLNIYDGKIQVQKYFSKNLILLFRQRKLIPKLIDPNQWPVAGNVWTSERVKIWFLYLLLKLSLLLICWMHGKNLSNKYHIYDLKTFFCQQYNCC